VSLGCEGSNPSNFVLEWMRCPVRCEPEPGCQLQFVYSPFSSGFDRTTIPRQVAPVPSNPRISTRLFPPHFAKFSPHVFFSGHFVYLNQSINRAWCSSWFAICERCFVREFESSREDPRVLLPHACPRRVRFVLYSCVSHHLFFLLCLIAVTVGSPFALFTCLVLCSM
jgi:hypothetical protein